MAQGAARGIDGRPFQLGGVEFVPSWSRPSRTGSLTLLKAERMVVPYQRLFSSFERPNVVELGISQGGSVALLAVLAEPRRLVAVELSSEPVEALATTLEVQGLSATVRPYYGVDQGDRVRLREIIDAEFGGAQLDVVIDDASHLYEPTVASFEVLFPLLRPGGVYVVEDWSWQDLFGDNLAAGLEAGTIKLSDAALDRFGQRLEGRTPRERPLSLLALHAVLARAHSGDAIAEVTVDENWISIRRGEGVLDPQTFRLTDLFEDHYGVLGRGDR